MEPPEPARDDRKIRIGLIVMGVVLAVSVALAVVVRDPLGRFIFGFVALACIVQLWRVGRTARRPG